MKVSIIAFQVFLLGCIMGHPSPILAFVPKGQITSRGLDAAGTTSQLNMAKKIRNKQAELAKKLALAKEQNAREEGIESEGSESSGRLSDSEIKEVNDRRRFDELLKTQSASMNTVASDGYLSKQQEDAEIDAYQRGLDRLFEGDPAPTQPFEELVNIKSENAIGDTGMRRLVPWLRNSASDYLIIVCDPRMKSPELRDATASLSRQLPQDILSKVVVINADTPAENRRWLKKSNLENVKVFSDEKREWMRSYTALGEDRWSMSMFIIADERLQKVGRDVEALSAVMSVQNAVNSMKDRRL